MFEDDEHSEDENEDISQVVELLRRVRGENLELKRNFESLKAIHLQLVDTHQQLEHQHAGLQDERVKMDRQYQLLVDSLRAELDDKQRELETAKTRVLKPRELDRLKVKLLAEVEAPYKLKCDNLTKEAEAAEQKLLILRREHDNLQTAYKSLEARSAADAELQAAEHLAIVTQLKDRLATLGNPQAKLSAAEAQVQQLCRERDSLAVSVAKLQDELADVRRQKERAVVEREAVTLKVERKLKDIQEEEVKLHGLVESLTRKNRHMHKELAEAHRANEEQFGQLMKVQAEKTAVQDQLDSLQKAAALDRQSLVQQYEDTIRRLEDQLAAARKEVSDRERQVADLHLMHQEQVSRLVEAQDVRLGELEVEAGERARQWREQRNELQAKLEALKDTCEGYRSEVESMKLKESSQVAAARREVDRLQAVLDECERQAASRALEVQQLRHELEATRAEATSLQLSTGHLTRRQEELEGAVARLENEAAQALSRQEALSTELQQARSSLEAEKVASLQHMEAARSAAAVERAALAKKYQASLHEVTRKHAEELKRAKKRLRQAQREVAQLMEELTDLRFRSHDQLQQLQGGVATAGHTALPFTVGVLGSPQTLTWSPGAASGNANPMKAGLSAAMLSDLAALHERQQAYLSAIEGMQTAAK